jgi:asparagine synthase (glutamine-hydrolysing)
MSVQFGSWNFKDQPPAMDYIEKVSATLTPYGPDSNKSYSKGGIKILYRAFHTTKESHREKQPHISSSGVVITWDGRLDNRADLISELRDSQTVNSTDLAIVAAAYEKWGANCFAKLIGDWALSLWNPGKRSLILAKDPIGTRHLYYSFDNNQVTWSTILDPLVLFAGKTFEICEEYIAGWLSAYLFSATHLTPYVGIHAVPPSSFALLKPGKHGTKHIINKYWDFDPSKRIRYRSDTEYEEHFRSALATAVQRRLRSDRPVLAELSGGMDSSSIVCMADTVIARGAAECPRLDTISWFDNSYDHIEPDVNERPYFTKVEEKRNRAGFHINSGALRQAEAKESCSRKSFESEFDNDRFAVTPIPNRGLSEHFKRYTAYMRSQGHRVTLSGIGGGEVTGGGVPTPTQELRNLIARAQPFTLVRQLDAWATKMRAARLPLFWEAARGFLPFAFTGVAKGLRSAPFLHPGFVRRNRAALCGYPFRVKLLGPLPSFQHSLFVLDGDRRLLSSLSIEPEMLRDIRFPYLDRDFLEFMFAIPWEQIVRVGKRRSLMKRALVHIVPSELISRRRKELPRQEAGSNVSQERGGLMELSKPLLSGSLGFIDPDRLEETSQKAQQRKVQQNEEASLHCLKRIQTLEFWFRHLTARGVLANPSIQTQNNPFLSPESRELQSHAQPKSLAS